ncbi:MAG: cyclase family protein [Desulfobacteraceae bacterium]|nr:cyclase family protein [Desulfobacteraceae bacterium]
MENSRRDEPRYVDCSHTIHDGLVTYRGLPATVIADHLSRVASRGHYAPGTEFQISRIEMVASTGTYLDCPFHRYEDGKDVAGVALEDMVDLKGTVVRAERRTGRAIGLEFFEGQEILNRAVLVHTGWDRHWETEKYFEGHPYLTEDVAVYLCDRGAKLVGIDSMNIDDTRGKTRPVHSILLRAGILIVEHMCRLEKLPDDGFTFNAVPPAFKGVGSFPVRAYARIG